ncbi:hypothetical protein A3C26_02920 [Candidatus Daviesbacteria bacterium RIFCSPHIGHO2_02_FULL_39_12]|uniref:NAD(+) kinase n=2 Tax=Candidatus Daviesiibacteriota TaxID=1752718 RepID=A0A1F5JDU9_9BACT|nr:MAG: hypothetical protein A3C26_02920 [Candidatus Daviesbacteria bacterium RIFCSPHIGHO2_02_FULL_39_12]OGE71464.1 MAG: hypothetical protein A3H40_02965 [Candidatus Daviesbacteria bacterium RIFCSPLOWO2_02_FULL_38_15]
MKVLLFGKNASSLEGLVKSSGLEVVDHNPDLIFSFGGDGTLLSAEKEYPGIPKLPMRNSQICKKCLEHEDQTVLKNLVEGKLHLKEYKKLQTTVLYKTIFALNDFVIRNIEPIHAIRFTISEIKLYIGDGVAIATPFGSTGYFKSITKKTFDKGFGLAFNNTTEQANPLYLEENDQIAFMLVRGQATLSFDNSPDIFTIDEGSALNFKLSNQTAKIYEAQSLRCPNCQVTRG